MTKILLFFRHQRSSVRGGGGDFGEGGHYRVDQRKKGQLTGVLEPEYVRTREHFFPSSTALPENRRGGKSPKATKEKFRLKCVSSELLSTGGRKFSWGTKM